MAMIACIDSDVLIDYFDGIRASAEELMRYDALLVSRISWMEVLVGARTAELAQVREHFLRQFKLIELDALIARRAIALRQEHRLRLPDAIVWLRPWLIARFSSRGTSKISLGITRASARLTRSKVVFFATLTPSLAAGVALPPDW